MIPIIAIDGPSGSGKGTISQLVAQRLGWHFLDSGALYRLVALAAQRKGIALHDEAVLARLAAALDVEFRSAGASAPERPPEAAILLDGADVTAALRTETCANAASQVAALPAVRLALLDRQRAFRRPPGLVADGRDMGSVVFPDAPLKIFLTASAEVRAERRYKQLKEKGINVTISSLTKEISERDARDSARSIAPLRPAAEAVVLDSSTLSIAEVVQRVLQYWQAANASG